MVRSAVLSTLLAVTFAASGSASTAHASDAPPAVTLTRLDCGGMTGPQPLAAFNDAGESDTLSKKLVSSCYLVRHGSDLLLWDTGIATPSDGWVPGPPLPEQLAELGVKPGEVKYVGISHYHWDHTGQAGDFPDATLLVGENDWQAIQHGEKPIGAAPANLAHWLPGNGAAKPGKVQTIPPTVGDLDLFGDGTVIVLNTPGHTPGHHSLLVRLKHTGPVLLTGDLVHYSENYAEDGVPVFNTSRAESLASIDRFKRLAESLKAMVVIQHEPADLAKLPTFPKAAD